MYDNVWTCGEPLIERGGSENLEVQQFGLQGLRCFSTLTLESQTNPHILGGRSKPHLIPRVGSTGSLPGRCQVDCRRKTASGLGESKAGVLRAHRGVPLLLCAQGFGPFGTETGGRGPDMW